MVNISRQGDNHVIYTKLEAILVSTSQIIFVFHIPTHLEHML